MAALAKYKYLGLSSVVEVDYPQPEVKLALWAAGSPPTYPGLDRFGRVVDHRWIDYGASPSVDVARIQHGYDRNSNRLWRQNDVARALSKKFDQQYAYDGLNRLTDAKTGLLNGSHVIPDADRTFEQQWTLDKLGNWSQFKQDDDGSGTFDLQQTRTANQVNEITAIGASAGPVWATPAYDPAGNTTSFPKPADPKESFTAVYDAWNRMVKVSQVAQSSSSSSSSSSSGGPNLQTVQENVYDGRNYRVIKKTYDTGALHETRHAYFTSDWQNVEERVGSSTDAERQYVWGDRYIDDLIARDRDSTDPFDGTLDERLYATQDPNWNVTTVIDEAGDLQERYEFEAYGVPVVLTPSFVNILDSAFSWSILFAGYTIDPSTRVYEVRRRILHPLLAIWMVRDPIEYDGGLNLYGYVTSPSMFTDPYGLDSYWNEGESERHHDKYICCIQKRTIEAERVLSGAYTVTIQRFPSFSGHQWIKISRVREHTDVDGNAFVPVDPSGNPAQDSIYAGFYPATAEGQHSDLFTSAEGGWVDESKAWPVNGEPRVLLAEKGGYLHEWETVTKSSGRLTRGEGKNAPCICVSDEEIVACIVDYLSNPPKQDFHMVFANCRVRSEEVLDNCCLKTGRRIRTAKDPQTGSLLDSKGTGPATGG